MKFTRSSCNFIGACGLIRLALPIWIADAPTRRYSIISSAENTPPTPIIGTFIQDLIWWIKAIAIGFKLIPDNPPRTLPKTGLWVLMSIFIAGIVLQTVKALAPAATADSAIVTILGTFGDNFTITGFLYSLVTAEMTLLTNS